MIVDWLKVEHHKGGVLQVELNNAPVNSLSATELRELRKFFNAVASDNSVSSVLLTSGLKVFSAGLNLKEAQTYDIEAQSDVVNAFHECFLELYSFPKPLICAVEGAAIAGGLFPVLCSDYRIAEEKAQFGLAEVRVGVGFPVGLAPPARDLFWAVLVLLGAGFDRPVTAFADGFFRLSKGLSSLVTLSPRSELSAISIIPY